MKDDLSFKKVRDLSGIFSVTFKFLKTNFKAFYGSIFLVAGPFLLIYSTVLIVALGLGNSYINFRNFRSIDIGEILGIYGTMTALMLIGLSIYHVIVNKNIIEQQNVLPDEKLTVRKVMSNFFASYWPVLGNMLLFALVSLLILVFIGFLFAGIFYLFFNIGNIFGVLMMLMLMGALFVFMPVLSYIPVAAFFVCQRDGLGIFTAISKVFKYMKGNFWNTWIVSFIALLTNSILSAIIRLPAMIMNFIDTLTRSSTLDNYTMISSSPSTATTIVTIISTLLSFGVLCIYHLMCIYHYGNLEESKEGSAMLDKINAID